MSTQRLKSAALCALAISLSGVSAASAHVALPNLQYQTNGNVVQIMMTYEDVVLVLEDAGYEIVEIKTTFLRRKKITARNDEGLREIIVTRSTGEILRDVMIGADGRATKTSRSSLFDSEGVFTGSGVGASKDKDDDDQEDNGSSDKSDKKQKNKSKDSPSKPKKTSGDDDDDDRDDDDDDDDEADDD